MGFSRSGARAWRDAMLACGFGLVRARERVRPRLRSIHPAPRNLSRSLLWHASLQNPLGTGGRIGPSRSGFPHRSFSAAGPAGEMARPSRETIDDERVQARASATATAKVAPSDAALKLLAIVDSARGARRPRAGSAKSTAPSIWRSDRPADLAQYGEIDVWSSPLVTLAKGRRAIARTMRSPNSSHCAWAGVPAEDLRIVVMRDLAAGRGTMPVAAAPARWPMADARQTGAWR